MSSAPVRIAVMGLGMVARDRHIPSLKRQKNVILMGVIDRHEGRAASIAKAHNLVHHAQTDLLDDVAWLDEIDALVLCTPVTGRAKLVEAALNKGKHVLVEKPCALTFEEGNALQACAQRAGKVLAVMHNFQFSRAARKLEKDRERDCFGTINFVSVSYKGNTTRRTAPWIETLPCGAFFDDSPHFFYLMRLLSQGHLTLENHYSPLPSPPTPRLIQLAYKDASGTPFTIQAQYDSPLHEWFLIVSGNKGAGIWDLYRDIYIRLPCMKGGGALSMAKTSLLATAQHLWGYVPNGLAFLTGRLDYGCDEVIERFVQSIQTNVSDRRIGWKEALAVLQLQQEALKAIKGNRSE